MSDKQEKLPVHVFIVTSGRTGSTLLMGLLNAHEHVHVRGENFGFFYYQYKALEALKLSVSHVGDDKSAASPFHGADLVDVAAMEQRIIDLCRRFATENTPPGKTVLGFKEIRYDMPDLEDYLDFLGRVFPAHHHVFLLRDEDDIRQSGFWKTMSASAALARIGAMQRRFRDFAGKHARHSTIIDYQDLVAPGETLKQLFRTLGISYDDKRVQQVLAKPHSYAPESVQFYDNIRLQLIPRRELQEKFAAFHFDRLARSEDDEALIIGGLLVPKKAHGDIDGLFAIPSHFTDPAAAPRIEGEFGIPSPHFHQKFPDDPRSKNARIKLTIGMQVGSVDIYLRQKGDLLKIGQLTLPAIRERHFFEPEADHAGGSAKANSGG